MPYDIYLMLEGSIYTKVTNVTAETKEDVNVYDASTYRDELNASFIGASPTLQGQAQTVLGSPVTPGNTIFDGVIAGSGSIKFDSAVGTDSSWDTTNLALFQQSDSFTHIAPRAWEKKRTRYVWTTTTGSFWAWADQIISVSSNPFGFIGSTLPA